MDKIAYILKRPIGDPKETSVRRSACLAGAGIDFCYLKKGMFTEQLQNFNSRNRCYLILSEFAHYMFEETTVKRALLYWNN